MMAVELLSSSKNGQGKATLIVGSPRLSAMGDAPSTPGYSLYMFRMYFSWPIFLLLARFPHLAMKERRLSFTVRSWLIWAVYFLERSASLRSLFFV